MSNKEFKAIEPVVQYRVIRGSSCSLFIPTVHVLPAPSILVVVVFAFSYGYFKR